MRSHICRTCIWHMFDGTLLFNKCWEQQVSGVLMQHLEVNMSCMFCLIASWFHCNQAPGPSWAPVWPPWSSEYFKDSDFHLSLDHSPHALLQNPCWLYLWNLVLVDGQSDPVSVTGHTCCVSSLPVRCFLFDNRCFDFKSLPSAAVICD